MGREENFDITCVYYRRDEKSINTFVTAVVLWGK